MSYDAQQRLLLFDGSVRSLFDYNAIPNTDETLEKVALLRGLVQKQVLLNPIAGYVVEWLRVDFEELWKIDQHGYFPPIEGQRKLAFAMTDNTIIEIVARYWMTNPEYDIMIGFIGGVRYHVWLYNPNTRSLREPSIYNLNGYFGYRVEKPLTYLQEQAERGLITKSEYLNFLNAA